MASITLNQRRPTQHTQPIQQQRPSTPTEPLSERLTDDQTEFYLKLILYSAVSPFKGKHSERDISVNIPEEHSELRRDFLDKLSYLCDINKSGATVTAAAMRTRKASNILYLAANENIGPEVKAFVELTMDRLRAVTSEKSEDTANAILQDAVGKGEQRFLSYRTKMLVFARQCRDKLQELKRDEMAEGLCSWIRKLIKSSHGLDWCSLVAMCYEARGQAMSDISAKADTIPKGDDGTNCYTELAHYIGRLGAYVHAVRIVVKAALSVPSIKQIKEVHYEEPSEIRKIAVNQDDLYAYRIMKKMCSTLGKPEMLRYMQAFVQQDCLNDFDARIRDSVQIQNNFAIVVTRVHAEILLADLFSRRGWKCVDNDNYIGCSKGACFCCASYLNLHHFNFVKPASHNKIILGWRGPEADPALDKRGLGAEKLACMEKRMNGRVRDSLLESLIRPGDRIGFQHLSTNGSSRESSVFAVRSLRRRD